MVSIDVISGGRCRYETLARADHNLARNLEIVIRERVLGPPAPSFDRFGRGISDCVGVCIVDQAQPAAGRRAVGAQELLEFGEQLRFCRDLSRPHRTEQAELGEPMRTG